MIYLAKCFCEVSEKMPENRSRAYSPVQEEILPDAASRSKVSYIIAFSSFILTNEL